MRPSICWPQAQDVIVIRAYAEGPGRFDYGPARDPHFAGGCFAGGDVGFVGRSPEAICSK